MKYPFLLCLTILMFVPAFAQDKEGNFIKSGQPTFLIVIGGGCGIEGNLGEREMEELAKNFQVLNPKVRMAWVGIEPLTFDNNKHSVISFRDEEDDKPCVRVAYWDGKKTSEPLLYDDLTCATEYFSPKLLKKKIISSYYTEFQERLKNFEQKKEHLTPRSKEVSDRYVKDVLITQSLMPFPIFTMDLKGVKRIIVKENDNEVSEKLYLNEEGLLLKRSWKESGEKEYKYKDGLLRQIIYHTNEEELVETTDYLYNDNELFEKLVKQETPPYDGKHFYYGCDYYQLQDNYLNQYQEGFSTNNWEIFQSVIKREGNKIIEKDNLNETVYTFSNTKNQLPISIEYSNDAGDKREGVITQKGTHLWKLEYANKLGEIYWDKQGRVTKLIAKDKETGEIKATYYYQYEMY